MEATMRHTLIALLMIAAFAVLSTTSAFATPASYHDDAWASFIEKKPGKVTPPGFPTGKGAVSRIHDMGVWPSPYSKLVNPTDLSKTEALLFSEQALVNERVYASENMAAFIAATIKNFRKLTKRSDIKIPIRALAYRADDIPTPEINDLMEVHIGFYISDESGPLPVVNIENNGNNIYQSNSLASGAEIYEKYVEAVMPAIQDLKDQPNRSISRTLFKEYSAAKRDLINQNRITKTENNNNARSERQDNIKKYNDIIKKYNDIIADLQQQYRQSKDTAERVELTKKIQKAQEDRTKESIEQAKLYNPKHAAFLERQAEISKPYDEAIHKLELEKAGLEIGPDSIDTHKEIMEKLRTLRNQRADALRDARAYSAENDEVDDSRLSRAQKAKVRETQQADDALQDDIDIETTWLLFESMLTQEEAPVVNITVPAALRPKLIIYAQGAKRSPKAIKRFEEVSVASEQRDISVRIACSIRDRFLGCTIKGDEATEKKVTQIAQQILNNAKSAQKPDKMHAMQLIVNADSQNLKDTLFSEKSKSKTKAKDALVLPFTSKTATEQEKIQHEKDHDLIREYKRICNIQNNSKSKGKAGKNAPKQRPNNRKRYHNGSGSLALPF